MTAQELYDNLNSTKKRLEYLENLLGYEIESVVKNTTNELRDFEEENRYSGELSYMEYTEDRKDDHFVVNIKDFLTFWLYGKSMYSHKIEILVFSEQKMKKLGRTLNLVEDRVKFKTFEEFKQFLDGLK